MKRKYLPDLEVFLKNKFQLTENFIQYIEYINTL